MFDRIFDWITVEPTVGLLMIITVVGLFAIAFSSGHDSALWPWLRRLIEAAIAAVLFLGLLWAFRSILNTNNATFYSTHGSLSNVSLTSAQSAPTAIGRAIFIRSRLAERLPPRPVPLTGAGAGPYRTDSTHS